MIRETILGSIKMEGVILNNCAIIDVDMKHIVWLILFLPFFHRSMATQVRLAIYPATAARAMGTRVPGERRRRG